MTLLEEIDKKDENGNDVVIKQFHHCSWSNSNNRWESSTFKQDGSKDKDWYWDNSNSKFVEKIRNKKMGAVDRSNGGVLGVDNGF